MENQYVEPIAELLRQVGLTEQITWQTQAIVLAGILLLSWLTAVLFRRLVIPALQKISSQTKVTWDDHLFKDEIMHDLCRLLPPLIWYVLLPVAFPDQPVLLSILRKGSLIYLIVAALVLVRSFLNTLYEISNEHETLRNRPLKGIYQMFKLIAVCIGGILIISILIDRDATSILAGLGASAAVLMLIFRDSILGFVSGIQLSANNMLKVGDWISMPKYGADGTVEEVTLNTVKVRNWDNTIVTLPPYLLVSDSFQNWEGMRSSGGRRVKRSINIDMTSIRFCTPEMLERYKRIDLLKDYIARTQQRVEEYNRQHDIPSGEDKINGLHQTNIGVFRNYLNLYLRQNERVNQNMMVLVRQLQPTEQGLPMELYFFTDTVDWVPYEGIQADVFDHVLAVIPEFDLRVFQNPSGNDLRTLTGKTDTNH